MQEKEVFRGLYVPAPICSTACLQNSNIILSFKTTDGANQARAHAVSWLRLVDPRATALHHTFAVVAHNALASVCNDPAMLWEAMTEIEMTKIQVCS